MSEQLPNFIQSNKRKLARILYLLPLGAYVLSLFLPAYRMNWRGSHQVPGLWAVIGSVLCLGDSLALEDVGNRSTLLRSLFLGSFAIANLLVLFSVVSLAFRTPRWLCIVHAYFGVSAWLIPFTVDKSVGIDGSNPYYITNFGPGFTTWAISLGMFAVWTALNRYAVKWPE